MSAGFKELNQPSKGFYDQLLSQDSDALEGVRLNHQPRVRTPLQHKPRWPQKQEAVCGVCTRLSYCGVTGYSRSEQDMLKTKLKPSHYTP
jgi:hypothetical protein